MVSSSIRVTFSEKFGPNSVSVFILSDPHFLFSIHTFPILLSITCLSSPYNLASSGQLSLYPYCSHNLMIWSISSCIYCRLDWCCTNLKKIWSDIKEIININKKSSTLPTSLTDKDRILTDQKVIADHFNSYFSGIAENILNNRKHKGTHSHKEYLKNPLPNSHMFFDCDPTEIECLISLLQTSKSSDPYSIPVNVLHMVKKGYLYSIK